MGGPNKSDLRSKKKKVEYVLSLLKPHPQGLGIETIVLAMPFGKSVVEPLLYTMKAEGLVDTREDSKNKIYWYSL